MKLKVRFFWLLCVVMHGEFFAMEHYNLKDVVIDQNAKVDQNVTAPQSLTGLMYTAALEADEKNNVQTRSPRQKGQIRSPRQVVQQIEGKLDEYIAELKDVDPEMYLAIMNFQTQAQVSGKTTEEIEGFIRENLNKLGPINLYKHLYSAQLAKVEADKKKDYELHEVLDENEPVDHSTLYHTFLYRAAATISGGKDAMQQEVEKAKGSGLFGYNCVEAWLNEMEKAEPASHAILMPVYEQVKNQNLNQHQASLQLLDAVNKLPNIERLEAMMKDIQIKETKGSMLYKAICFVLSISGVGFGFNGALGGVLGGLFATKNVTMVTCTLGQCLALMNVTIG